MRRVLLQISSAAAWSAFCALPAAGQERAAASPDQLPAITITPPEAKPRKRVVQPRPSQSRRPPRTIAGRSGQSATEGEGTTGDAADANPSLQPTAASSVRFSGEQVNSVPFSRVGETLEIVPGLIVTQHSGEGKANQYFLRGFNLDHGTDLSIFVDGMPVNMPTHGHGQGYADINFLIPELIKSVNVRKGPYYADVGDFSSAGSVAIDYISKLPKNFAETTFGSFGYRRAVAAGSAAVGDGTLLTAIDGTKYDGPWDVPNNIRKINGVLRYSRGTATDALTLTAMASSNGWNSTDQVAQRAIDQGIIGRFGTLPTAEPPAVSACPATGRNPASMARARSAPMSSAPTCSSSTISLTFLTTPSKATSSIS